MQIYVNLILYLKFRKSTIIYIYINPGVSSGSQKPEKIYFSYIVIKALNLVESSFSEDKYYTGGKLKNNL